MWSSSCRISHAPFFRTFADFISISRGLSVTLVLLASLQTVISIVNQPASLYVGTDDSTAGNQRRMYEAGDVGRSVVIGLCHVVGVLQMLNGTIMKNLKRYLMNSIKKEI